jgi:SAM-dependent methyltransferase
MFFLQQIIEESRLFRVLYDNLPHEVRESELYSFVANYLGEYAADNEISPDYAIEKYTEYIARYNKDCRDFFSTGKYPAHSCSTDFSISRESYDLVLMLSVLFTPHRYRIMELLEHRACKASRALYIGFGPGLEIAITGSKYDQVMGYDLYMNRFLEQKFPDYSFNTELYNGQYKDYFQAVYLVELLEHLEDPYNLLAVCHDSLITGGKVYLTTATNMPQFDHLYNFPEDHTDFEEQLRKIGFNIVFKEKISHRYLSINISPSNHFFILEKGNNAI